MNYQISQLFQCFNQHQSFLVNGGIVVAKKAPGRSERRGVSIADLLDSIPNEAVARAWFEKQLWSDGPR